MFRALASAVLTYPRTIVVSVLMLSVALALQTRHLRLDMREADQLPQDHPYVQIYNRINQTFGGGSTIVVGIVARRGDVFQPGIIARVDRITRAIEQLPDMPRGTVTSLTSPRVKSLRSSGGDDPAEPASIDILPLVRELPRTPDELEQLRRDVFVDPANVGFLVSADASVATVVASFPPDIVYPEVHAQVEAIVAPERDELTDVVLAGAPIVISRFDAYTAQIAILFPIAVLVIGIVHFEAFRTLQAMFLPLVTALLAVLWSLGAMGALRLTLDAWTALTPVAILAVAAGHAVQILKRYYEEYAACGDGRLAVARAIERVGPVMVVAGVIAAAGFASLATFGVKSVKVFGLQMAFGILAALFIEMTFTPACRVLLPAPKDRERRREREERWLDRALDALASQVLSRPGRLLAIGLAVVGIFLLGLPRLEIDNSLRRFLPADDVVRADDALINERLGGTSTFSVLIAGERAGALHDPEVLRAISDLQGFLGRFPETGKTLSLVDYVKQIHRAMDPGAAAADPIPDRADLIAQYLLLYSFANPDPLSSFVDADYRDAVVLSFSRSDEAAFADKLFGRTREFVAERFAGLPVSVGVAGGSLGAQAAMNAVIVREKLINMAQVAGIIFLLSSLVLRSALGGALVLAPLLAAATVLLGLMGWSGVWLSISTSVITAMGLGIGADFAVYMIFRLREELHGADLPEAMRRALNTSGKAVFFVSSAVSLGFLVLACSRFVLWFQLGSFIALMMAVSALASLTLLPPLIMLLRPRFLAPSGAASPGRADVAAASRRAEVG